MLGPPGKTYYPRLVRRVRAYLIDQVVMLAIGLSWLLLLPWMSGFTPAQKILMLAVPLLICEPCLVSLTGGTIGHHLMCLRIRDAREERNLGFVRATLRALLRLFFGWLSLVFILTTRRRQALHDVLTHSLVVIASPARLPDYDLLPGLTFDSRRVTGMPSKWRRGIAILLYCVAATVALGAVDVALISPECTSSGLCTRQDEIVETVCGGAWLAAAVTILILGARGRLWGARRAPIEETVPVHPDPPL